MKKISEHISIYISQFFSMASILGRISINGIFLVFPIIILINFSTVGFFFLKNILIVSVLYHIGHFFKKVFFSENGLIGFSLLLILILVSYNPFLFWDQGFFVGFFLLLFYHCILGFDALLKDYSISDFKTVKFFSVFSFLLLKSVLLTFFFLIGFF